MLAWVRVIREFLWSNPYAATGIFLSVLLLMAVLAPPARKVSTSQQMEVSKPSTPDFRAVQAGNSDAEGPTFDGPTRSLQFPEGQSIGTVKYRLDQDEDWQDLGQARGVVEVPTEHDVWFGLYGESSAAHIELIAQFPPDAFHTVSIAGVPLPPDVLEKVVKLSELRELDLHTTYADDSVLAALENLTKLETLDISRTLITDAGFEHLTSMQSLKRLVIEEPLVSDEALQQFIESHPEIEVVQ
jgi:hypothetical protein